MPLKNSRRNFLKTTSVATAGLSWMSTSSAKATKAETLALNGGKKAVTKGSGASRWPLYGKDEVEAVTKLVTSPSYAPL
ncbi:MAG: twin-arginine translocation signal domain-containing protein, partial [Chloroflexota bacterium]|nr:twin-arginine translocation signal domain-containing protein [Chloroflexota bacterium]